MLGTGAAALAVVVLGLIAFSLQGHRAWSRDRSFLLIAPPNWTQSFAAVASDDTTPLLRLSGPTSPDGLQAHVVVDHAPAILPEHLDQLVTNAGPAQCDSPPTPTTVGTADALRTDCRTTAVRLEVVYITRGDQRYVAMLSAGDAQFDHLRDDFRSMIGSWAWQR